MPSLSRLIVGLGNPGTDYAATRHNIGFMALDAIAARYGVTGWKTKFKGLIATAENGLLLKPQTFMNLSGESVAEALRFHKMIPEQVIVFHDDLDLKPGEIRVKQGGGTGGHNGLKSLDAHIGPDYWRVRLGIGHPGMKGDVVTNYVLGAFNKPEWVWVEALGDILAAEFGLLLTGKIEDYRAKVTQKMTAQFPELKDK